MLASVIAVIPAWNEEGSLTPVVTRLLAAGIGTVIVADNGSTDRTAEVARAAGAQVVPALQRGYGAACLAGLAAVPADAVAVVFCDADGADDLSRLEALCSPVVIGLLDLHIGSRALGQREPGALTPPQLAGNLVATLLLRLLFWRRVTDLGPFRCISCAALARLAMQDRTFGWTAEMQTKALRLGLRYGELAVDAKVRTAGESKISGRILPVFKAGWAIITTILRYRLVPLPSPAQSPLKTDRITESP
jgi:glycosyltransferase involved in cell wall biosynthesis